MRYSILELELIDIRLMTGHRDSRHDVALCASESKAKTHMENHVCFHAYIVRQQQLYLKTL